jgi:hypothetical protein
MSSGPPARRKYDKRGKNNKNDKEGILDSGLNRTPSDQFVLSTEVVLKPSSTEFEVIKNEEESTSGASLQMGINQPMDTPLSAEAGIKMSSVFFQDSGLKDEINPMKDFNEDLGDRRGSDLEMFWRAMEEMRYKQQRDSEDLMSSLTMLARVVGGSARSSDLELAYPSSSREPAGESLLDDPLLNMANFADSILPSEEARTKRLSRSKAQEEFKEGLRQRKESMFKAHRLSSVSAGIATPGSIAASAFS